MIGLVFLQGYLPRSRVAWLSEQLWSNWECRHFLHPTWFDGGGRISLILWSFGQVWFSMQRWKFFPCLPSSNLENFPELKFRIFACCSLHCNDLHLYSFHGHARCKDEPFFSRLGRFQLWCDWLYHHKHQNFRCHFCLKHLSGLGRVLCCSRPRLGWPIFQWWEEEGRYISWYGSTRSWYNITRLIFKYGEFA